MPDREPAQDLLILRGEKVPGANPRYQDHHPTYTTIVDVWGNTRQILECRVAMLKPNSAGLGVDEQRNVYTPIPVPELWEHQPEHVLLTHSLRILQVSTYHHALPDAEPELRKLRKGFTPLVLLKGAGLVESQAEEVLRRLKNLGLVVFRSARQSEVWLVTILYKGIGPNYEKYTKAAPTDGWALPEVTGQAGEVPAAPSLNGSGPQDDEGGDDVADDEITAEESDRKVILNKALEVIRSVSSADFVATNGQTAPDGYIQAQPEGGFIRLLQKEVDVEYWTAAELLQDLTSAGLVEGFSMGPKPRLVRMREDAGPVSDLDILRIRAAKRKGPKAQGRLVHLYPAYLVLLEQMPEGTEPDENGIATWETQNVSYKHLLAERITELTLPQAERLLYDFDKIGVFRSESVGKGGVFKQRRHLKLGIKHFTKEDLDRIRSFYRRGVAPQADAAATTAPTAESPPDEIEQYVVQAAELLDARAAEIERLEGEVGQLRAELEASQQALKERDVEIERLRAEIQQPKARVSSDALARLKAHLPGEGKK